MPEPTDQTPPLSSAEASLLADWRRLTYALGGDETRVVEALKRGRSRPCDPNRRRRGKPTSAAAWRRLCA